jgi:hypothetical protein
MDCSIHIEHYISWATSAVVPVVDLNGDSLVHIGCDLANQEGFHGSTQADKSECVDSNSNGEGQKANSCRGEHC